mmetsp:Transcript_15619/g.28405  ORF Transcript_15619/g.28405 Transcript_15619/m.28405 type:complete len:190 (-) Transcript_15619:1375-1944(-)
MQSQLRISSHEVTNHSFTVLFQADPKALRTWTHYELAVRALGREEARMSVVEVPVGSLGYTLVDLMPGTLYEVRAAPVTSRRTLSFTLPLVVKTYAPPKPKLKVLEQSERNVAALEGNFREVLLARRARDWHDYTHSSYKFSEPADQTEKRLARVKIYCSALDVFDMLDISPEDDHFSGPLYKRVREHP